MSGDRIILRGMAFFAYHGVDPAEIRLGQRFVVDLVLHHDLAPAGRSDDLNQTIDYAGVYELVRAEVEGPPCRLIEHLAERIAARALATTPAGLVTVTVTKPWAPIRGSILDAVAVEITRSRPRQQPGSSESSPDIVNGQHGE